jgi:ComF family protein
MLEVLLNALVPPRCLACGAAGADVCAACRRRLPFLTGPLCERCGLPQPCGRRCPAALYAFDAAYAPVAHDGPAKDLVHALKFHHGRRAAATMAAQIAANAPPGLLGAGSVLVPAPAHPSRANARGYDQAVVLAAALGRRTGLPVQRLLRRRGPATRQLGASRARRTEAGRIKIVARSAAPQRVIVVDDVHTTGATLDACARALRVAGAQRVVALTYARTL